MAGVSGQTRVEVMLEKRTLHGLEPPAAMDAVARYRDLKMEETRFHLRRWTWGIEMVAGGSLGIITIPLGTV